MDWTFLIGLTVLIVTLTTLVSASVSDWRTREISDRHWYIIGLAGICGGTAASLAEAGFHWYVPVNALVCAALLVSLLGGDRKYDLALGLSALIGTILLLLCGWVVSGFEYLSAAVILAWVILLGYWFGVIRGGADAKCLIVLGFAIPSLPLTGVGTIPSIISSLCFSGNVAVLFLASVFSVCSCMLYCAARNLWNWEPVSVRGYRMEIENAEKSYVWPTEDLIDGHIARCAVPADEDVAGIYRRLREAGADTVFVEPVIPFIVPITAASLAVVLLGNPLILLC